MYLSTILCYSTETDSFRSQIKN